MPIIVSFISQKGGVGKSTLARALAAVASYGLRVRLADLDARQTTVVEWERVRRQSHAEPPCEVVGYATVEEALADCADVDLLIFDAPAGGSHQTLELAQVSDVLVQPTGASADDLRPAVLLFHELVRAGIPDERLVAAVCRTMSDTEEEGARHYLQSAGYAVLDGCIPERSTYREAQNRGAAITETRLAHLNERANALIEALLETITRAMRAREKMQTAVAGAA